MRHAHVVETFGVVLLTVTHSDHLWLLGVNEGNALHFTTQHLVSLSNGELASRLVEGALSHGATFVTHAQGVRVIHELDACDGLGELDFGGAWRLGS